MDQSHTRKGNIPSTRTNHIHDREIFRQHGPITRTVGEYSVKTDQSHERRGNIPARYNIHLIIYESPKRLHVISVFYSQYTCYDMHRYHTHLRWPPLRLHLGDLVLGERGDPLGALGELGRGGAERGLRLVHEALHVRPLRLLHGGLQAELVALHLHREPMV
eukprot:4980923-Pyramimonas_sp.AAC.1